MRKILAGLLFILPLVAQAGFDEGAQAYATGDYATAMKEFLPAAEQGDPKAEYYVGHFYHHGYGVPVDLVEAVKWYRKAAAKGDSRSQFYLGKMAEKGQGGMERSLVDAHMWLTLSAKNAPNTRDAAYTHEDIGKLERKMSKEQIAEAKQLASQWKASN